ncbi:MAG: hypothetical protein A3K77_06340 [Euryarchaeota archaeon RBG_13_31_8]|nr:MAG: hypothetical protein A3K77_06340 [Euryarchaeota archaeon RBG_13_31_8]
MREFKKSKDLRDFKFNRLKPLYIDNERTIKKVYWICKCDCGNIISTRSDSLQSGRVKSCGCIKKEQDKINLDRTTHDLSKTRIYKIWQHIKERCYSHNSHDFCRYGGRGIKVYNEWFKSFDTFYHWAINNGYKENLTIDRINNNGNYEPNNCKWSTYKEQANNRRTNIKINFNNKIITLLEFSEFTKISYHILRYRIKKWIREYRGNVIDGERLLHTVERRD